jgi:predicted metal-dependent hydrolase
MSKGESHKIVEYKNIGKVIFIKKDSVRSIKITVKPFKDTQVVLPGFMSFEKAVKYVEEKQSWIIKSRLKLSKYEKKLTIFNEGTEFRTKEHYLIIAKHSKSTIRCAIRNDRIEILYPDFADVNDPRIQKVIRKSIHAALKMEAQKHLPDMLRRLADYHQLHYSQVRLRNNKTRWGSCSRDNSISLNIHLIRLPQHLCEYVILHELCHTLYKNHQKPFWQFLEKLTGGKARELDKGLNHFSPHVW